MSKVEINDQTIDEIESYIKLNVPKEDICISPKDKFSQNEAQKLIKDDKINSLYVFGNSGFRTYYFYKSCSNQIYLIETYLDKLDSYCFY